MRSGRPRWYPGMYEGKQPGEAGRFVGTAVPKRLFRGESATPPDMRPVRESRQRYPGVSLRGIGK